jgi:hypothetical protein
MHQQYSCAKQNPDHFPTGSFGWNSSSLNSSMTAAQVAAAEMYVRRSSSSSSSGGGSGSSSFTLKQEAAAAFAAAAAADALRPCHVLPELLDVDFTNSAKFTAHTKGGAAAPGQGFGVFPAPSSSSSSSKYQQQGGQLDESDEFTWQEFLATVAAINYPNKYRQQQQQLSRQASLVRGAGGCKGHISFTAKASASLGPIAEGLEVVGAVVTDQNAAPASHKQQHRGVADRVSADASTVSVSSAHPGAQLTARSIGAPADSATPEKQQQQQLLSAASARPPAVQQLALEEVDQEWSSLGLQPTGADPTTPTVLFGSTSGSKTAWKPASSSSSSSGIMGLGGSGGKLAVAAAAAAAGATAAGAADGMWAVLDADAQLYARAQAAPDADTGSAAAATAVAATAAAETRMPIPPEGRPAKDPSRRVTLFTESMRERGECPAPPRSPRFERGNDSQGKRHNLTLSGAKLDEILDSAATAAAGAAAGM